MGGKKTRKKWKRGNKERKCAPTVRFLKLLTHHFNEALCSWKEEPDLTHKPMHSEVHGGYSLHIYGE